ncbi:M15 family metallopeptidase [Massilibacterium senegalense]|uniref:M15 family metallopeptidase n=1 Tax=Massilibacterium senegalense TaxID=1632858 RepID=UPI0007822F5C|nr:M15 family metallopeptidase [Massilibacterium senegalense]
MNCKALVVTTFAILLVSGCEDKKEVGVEKVSNTQQVQTNINKESESEKQELKKNPLLILVNKNHAIDQNNRPTDLVIPKVRFPYEEDVEKKYIKKDAAEALAEMFQAAEKESLFLYGQSGYRSYERQVTIYNGNVQTMGEEKANAISAKPGESEHQTGLVMDITCEAVGFDVVEEFGETKEGKWVADNAHKYGFIIRYPKGKEEITGYSYEPWHLRYVGVKPATEITKKGITLEEYLGEK